MLTLALWIYDDGVDRGDGWRGYERKQSDGQSLIWSMDRTQPRPPESRSTKFPLDLYR